MDADHCFQYCNTDVDEEEFKTCLQEPLRLAGIQMGRVTLTANNVAKSSSAAGLDVKGVLI